MKVFISWSGQRSQAVAELLHDWLKCVIQVTKPWVSSRDIDRGTLWFSEINEQLKDTSIGIICITEDNKNKPWILFEAGALAKGLSTNRVCTFLIDLKPEDLENPLAQFNHSFPTRESMLALVRTINASLKENSLVDNVLENVFNTYWGQFDDNFQKILSKYPISESVTKRSEEDILAEILNTTRGLERRIRSIEYTQRTNNERNEKLVPMPPNAVRRRIKNWLEEGMEPAQIVDRLSSMDIPKSIIFNELELITKNIENDSESIG